MIVEYERAVMYWRFLGPSLSFRSTRAMSYRGWTEELHRIKEVYCMGPQGNA